MELHRSDALLVQTQLGGDGGWQLLRCAAKRAARIADELCDGSRRATASAAQRLRLDAPICNRIRTEPRVERWRIIERCRVFYFGWEKHRQSADGSSVRHQPVREICVSAVRPNPSTS